MWQSASPSGLKTLNYDLIENLENRKDLQVIRRYRDHE
jgi:hypothetical protein